MPRAPRGPSLRYQPWRTCIQCEGTYPTWDFPLTRPDKQGNRRLRLYCSNCRTSLTHQTRVTARRWSHREYYQRNRERIPHE